MKEHILLMIKMLDNDDLRDERVTQLANIGPQDVPTTSSYNVPRTSPKDPMWLSQRRPELTS